MSKVCKHCNLAWRDTDDINFCTSCGRPLEFVQDQQTYAQTDNRQNQQNGQYQGPLDYQDRQADYNRHSGQPIPKDSILESYKKFWKNYVVFEGRSRRADFWQVVLVNLIIGIVLGSLSKIPFAGRTFLILSYIYSIAAIIPGIALSVRRLHDIGKSGLYYLLVLIPIVGAIILLVWYASDSEPGTNQYGKNPKYT